MNEKNKGTECTFCELGPKKLMTTIPLYMKENINKSNVAENGLDEKLIVRTEKIVELDRWIDYEKNNGDFVWYAILSPEQYSKGHTLVILKKHRSDITDNELNLKEIEQLNEGIQRISRRMKNELEAKRIYIASLCDGVQHFHYHLIPRYETDITGFTFMGNRELAFNMGNSILPEKEDEIKEYFSNLVKILRKPDKENPF